MCEQQFATYRSAYCQALGERKSPIPPLSHGRGSSFLDCIEQLQHFQHGGGSACIHGTPNVEAFLGSFG